MRKLGQYDVSVSRSNLTEPLTHSLRGWSTQFVIRSEHNDLIYKILIILRHLVILEIIILLTSKNKRNRG